MGSIRKSGRAAADDLRALSRPGTAPATSIVISPTTDMSLGTYEERRGRGESLAGGRERGQVLEVAAAITLCTVQPPASRYVGAGEARNEIMHAGMTLNMTGVGG